MRLKEKVKTEKGITLVALIITIIVLIILAAVTIKSFYDSKFMNTAMNGTINYAKAQGDEVEMMQNISDKLDETVNKIENLNIGGIAGGETGGSTGGGNPPEETTTPLPAGWNGDKVYAEKTDDGEIVPVPKGFTSSDKPEERKEETGYVIKQDGTNNEFVWVPVPKDGTFGTLYTFSGETATPNTNTNYREPDVLTDATSGDASTQSGRGIEQLTNVVGITGANNEEILANWKKQLEEEYADMKTSVETYGGFYIGRYETGNLSQNTAVVEKGNTDINNQKWYKMYKVSKSVAEGTGVTSTMIWGCQWDATLKWFLTSTDSKIRTYVTNSRGMGNYKDTNGNQAIPTGSNPDYSVNNIYDMAGNVIEWTLEAYGTYGRVDRRG